MIRRWWIRYAIHAPANQQNGLAYIGALSRAMDDLTSLARKCSRHQLDSKILGGTIIVDLWVPDSEKNNLLGFQHPLVHRYFDKWDGYFW